MRVSAVIRARNEEAHIGRLLAGMRRQSRPPDQIVLVDSGSTDATLAIAREFGVEVVSIAPEDFSFGRALNAGLAACDCEFAVLASAHVYPIYESWIEHLTSPFEDQRIALTYGSQRAPAGGRFSERRIYERWFPSISERPQPHPFCNNANAAIRRSVWNDLPYSESLTGLEDLDWAKRALDGGHLLAYVAEAPIIHVHDETFAQIVNRYRREAIAHKQIYPEQNLSGATAFRLAASHITRDLRAAHSEGLLGDVTLDVFRFRAAQFFGTHQGFRQRGPITEALKDRFYYPGEDRDNGRRPPAGLEERPIDYDDPL